ncbi:MAG TPA: hypothetical protein VMA96_05805 [Solirubrobacteraceae bacterium]|nr:hypothetical protein [Solirubrobacteraceae bacterium]
MTADSPAKTTREPVPGRGDRAELGLPAPTILSMCDQLLGEVGRRHHMFTWLRAPSAGTGDWLAVDSYYPRARLVVMCRSRPGPYDALYREQVPAHGLGLLTFDPAALGNDREAVGKTLAAKFFELEQASQGHGGRTSRPGAPTVPSPSRETARKSTRETARESVGPAERPAPRWTPVKVERTPVPRGFIQALGVLAGLAFAALLIAEIYLAVIVVAFHAGKLVLGLAILIEALSRVGGTVAAERAERRGWACACAIFGAPVVAWISLVPRTGRITTEPAPLAGLLALLAGAVALVGLITGT